MYRIAMRLFKGMMPASTSGWPWWPLCGHARGTSTRVHPDNRPAPVIACDWPAEVDTYGLMLRTKYGPFIVMKGGPDQRQKRKRTVTPPLIDLGILLDAAKSSKPLSKSIATAGMLLGYTEWASRRLTRSPQLCTAKQVVAADAIADRHGLPEALYVGAAAAGGHAWVFDEAWISEFSREERIDGSFSVGHVPPSDPSSLLLASRLPSSRFPTTRLPESQAPVSIDLEIRRKSVAFDLPGASVKGGSPERSRKRASIPSAVRMALWNKHFGREAGVGECFCCGEKIYQQAFECGHVLAAAKGGSDAVHNLRPLCSVCNRSQGDDHMDDFIALYFPHRKPAQNEFRKGEDAPEAQVESQTKTERSRVRLRARRSAEPMILD